MSEKKKACYNCKLNTLCKYDPINWVPSYLHNISVFKEEFVKILVSNQSAELLAENCLKYEQLIEE